MEAATINGVICDMLDKDGRLIVTPNAYTTEGQTNIPAILQDGDTLETFLVRNVEYVTSGWVAAVDGVEVPREDWSKFLLSDKQIITCRAVVGKAVVQIAAIVALTYVTFGLGTLVAGGGYVAAAFGGGLIGSIAAMGVYMVGSMLINKVLGPKPPSPPNFDQGAAKYSLADQRNSARPNEPIGIVWGHVRGTPDLASKTYTSYVGDDQFLNMVLLSPINAQDMADLSVGDTPLSNYTGVELYWNNVPAHPQQNIPLYSNVDTIAGAELVIGDTAGVVRVTSVDTLIIEADIEGQLYDVDRKGNTTINTVQVFMAYKPTGSADSAWVETALTITNAKADTVRRTISMGVTKGQYDVRVRLGVPRWNEGDGKDACKLSFAALRSIQEDTADYSSLGRLALRIKASGQLSGSLDTLRADLISQPIPVWTTAGWQTATTRDNGLSNPGAIMLQALRGIRDGSGKLLWGFGYPDEMIDIEAYKSFMLRCTAAGFKYDKYITSAITLGEFMAEVSRSAMAEFAWVDGSKPSVAFVSQDQPLSGVVGMSNMLKGTFSVDYNLSNAADGIELQYVDRNKNWETQTLRVSAPGVVTMLNPAQVTVEGVTDEAVAAILARYHLAQSIYQFKTISYGADVEKLDYRRLAILSVSHDMTQWGYSGRLLAVTRVGGKTFVQLSEPVPSGSTPFLGLRLPGGRDYRVFGVAPFSGESDTLELVDWPADLALPGQTIEDPAHDTIWCYDFKSTPGYRVRVVSMESDTTMTGATVTCVPEGPEFWNYVLNGTYEPAPNQSLLPQLATAKVSNVRLTEQTNIQGDTEWYEFHILWDVEGEYDHAQVWAGLDGSELKLVDAAAFGTQSTIRIDQKGEWLIRVVPFNPRGQAGASAAIVYKTVGVDAPPFNPSEFTVMEIEGSLRRYMWNYVNRKPAALAGVQIRYVAGDVALSDAMWDDMIPVGELDDVYRSSFVTTKPGAGVWTFGLKAVNTGGIAASGMTRFVVTLNQVFDNILQPDLTPPPTPTGFSVATAFANAMLSTDVPTYLEGHGPDKTIFYVAEITEAKPNPVFADARIAAEVAGTMGSAPVSLGHKYRWWAKWQSADGVLSVLPTAPVDSQVGLIGGSDLADDIITAEKLANGSITAYKLADGAVDITKFASGLEPILVVDTLPTEKKTTTVSYDGKIYRWDGTKYTAEIPTVDLIGQISVDQIPDGALNATKFASGIEPITILDHIPVQKQTETISVNGKLYHWEQDRYTANVEAADIVGKITGIQIADGALNINNFTQGIEPVSILPSVPANKVTSAILVGSDLYRWDGTKYVNDVKAQNISGQIGADQLATGAVTNDKIAAGVIDAGKFASDVEPVKILSAVPGYKVTSVISVGGVMYRWNGTKYTNAVTAVEIEGQISGDQIKANALDATKFASSIEPVTLVSAIPAVKVTSVISYNGVMYRWDGAKYTRNVATSELEGQIVDQQIAAGAVSAAKFAGNIEPVTIVAALPATKITSAVSFNGVMYRWDGTKYTVQTPASAITGQLTSAQIASLETAKLAGQITETQIADNSISTPKILAGAVMAQQIAAGAIVAGKIAADAVQAGNLAAGSVVAGKIAADAVQAANIAAGAVQATHIAAKAITAEKLVIGSAANLLPDTSDWGIDGGGSRWDGMGMGAQIGNSSKWVRDKYIGTLAASFEVQAGITYLASIEASPTNYSRIVMELIPEGPTEFNPRQFILDVNAAATDPATFTTYSAKFTPTASQRVRLRLSLNDNGAAGLVWIRKPVISPMSDGSLIVDGAITAGKIAANSITASKLVVSDNSTLVPDAEYQDASMWGAAPGTVSLVYEPSGYAGTVSNRVARLDRSSDPYEWHCVFSKPFALQPKTNYALRASVYVPFACRVISRLRTYDSPSGDGNLIEKYHDLVAGWHKLEWSGITGELASTGQIFMFVGSGSPFMLVGKIMVTEAVSAALIVDGAIIAGKLAADAVTAGTIAAGAISAREIAAGSITTNKLVVSGQGTCITDDPYLQDAPNAWVYPANVSVVGTAGGSASTNKYFYTTTEAIVYTRRLVSIDPNKTYNLSASLYSDAGDAGLVHILIDLFDAFESRVGTSWGGAFSGYAWYGVPTANDWKRYGGQIGQGTSKPIPAKVRYARIGAILRYQRPNNNNIVQGATDIRLEQVNDANLIVDGAIIASKIAAGAITSDKIVAGAISTDKLAANSVTALNLAAGAVTTAKLAAGAVVADTIAAGAVTAAKLVVTDTSSVNIDPTFQDSNFWNDGNNFTAVKQIGDGVAGPNVFYSVAGYSTLKNANKFNIDYTKTYLFEVWVRKLGPSDGTEFASARFFDSAGNLITANLNNYWPISFAAAGNCYWPSPSTALPVGAWTRYTTTCGPDGVNKFPPGATQCAVGVFFNYSSTSPAEVQYNCIRVTEMSRAELIVDGAITANKIAANSITASKLVVADYSTLMPDSEYQDTKMWTALDGGTFNFQSEPSSYAGTLNKVVLMLNHVENGHGYDGVLSSPFSVTPDKEYAVRINMYVNAPARILVRAMMASGVTPTRNIDTEKVLDVGQWFTFTTSFTPNSSESAVRLAIYIWEQSTSRFVLIGKIRVQEAISTGLLVEGAVTASKVAANAITADKIAANAITAGKLAAGAVTAGTLAAGVVTATEIAAGTITASRMAIGDNSTMMPDPEYADRSMWRVAGAGSVLDIVPTSGAFGTANNRALKLYVGTERYSALFSKEFSVVPGRTYTAKTVFYADAKAYAIFRVVMIDTVLGTERYNEYTTSVGGGYDYPIVTVQPTARENAMRIEVWLDKTNTVSNIVMGKVKVQEAIDATLIVDGAVIADKLATNSVVSSKIAAGSVTTDKLVANVITADKLAAGSVTAGKLAADSVTAGVIAAGAISAREIAAGAITTNKLVVNGQGTCITDDPTLLDAPNAWVYPANVSVVETAGGSASTNKYFKTTTEAIVYNSRTVSIDPNKVYNLSASFYTDAGDAGMMYVLIDMFDAWGNQVGTSWGGSFSGYAWAGVPAAGNWNRYGAQIGLGTAKPIPANVRTARIGAIMKYQRYTDNGIVQGATDFRLEQASGAELIVDGAIIASKIAVNAVTADKIEANAITSDKIAANAITADKVAANAITTAKLAAGAVTASQIAAGAITTDKLAAGSITASKIVLGDTSTLVPDPEYRDASMWWGILANVSIAWEPNDYAGTLSRNVINLTRGSNPYEYHSVRSSNFSVRSSTRYLLQVRIYVPYTCAVIVRFNYGSQSEDKYSYFEVTETYAPGWQTVEVVGSTAADSNIAYVGVWIGSQSPFILVGKIVVREAVGASLIVDGAITATKLAANSIVAGTAAIQNGAIVNAMIANATIDDAKIATLNVNKLVAGALKVDTYISTTNYVSGSSGLALWGNGSAEFNNVTVRGSIYSSNGNIGGVRINGNGLNTGSYSGYAWPTGGGGGFHLGVNGLLFGNPSTGRYFELQQSGNLYAPGFRLENGNAYFSGQLSIQSAASGARLVINNSQVLVYDANNVLRVRLGIW